MILRSLIITFVTTLLIALSSGVSAQETTIEGSVTEKETGEPLPGVQVYLANTTIGTITQENGSYSFTSELQGVYDLIFSFVGYKKVTIQVNLDRSQNTITHNVEMATDVIKLEELKVESSNKEFQQNLRLFRKEFIGTSDFANETKINNPWVLNFNSVDKSDLVATTEKPLIIENNALGYRIYIELDQFVWNYTGSHGFFRIYPKFEELSASDRKTERRWERNRKKAYRGSIQHFLKSLYNGKHGNQMFTVTQPAYLLQLTENEAKFELLGKKGVSRELRRSLKGFKLLNEVEIVYGQKSEYQTKRFGASLGITHSTILPNTQQGIFFVDELGNLLIPTSIQVTGEWANDRMASRLPLDYAKNR